MQRIDRRWGTSLVLADAHALLDGAQLERTIERFRHTVDVVRVHDQRLCQFPGWRLRQTDSAPARPASSRAYDSLSERQRETFQLIGEGHSNKEIADVLGVSPATVDTHRAHILQKLDLHNTAELVLYAVRHGVIS